MVNEKELVIGIKSERTQNILYVNNEDLELPHGQNYVYAINLMENIQNSQINDESIPKLFLYDNFSIWWVLYQSLIPEIKKITNFIHQLSKLLDSENITKITVNTNFDKLNIIKEISSKKNIPVHYSHSVYLKYKISNKTKNSIQKKRYSKIFEEKTDKRKNIFEQKFSNLPDINNKIIFPVSTNFHRDVFDFTKNQSIRGEYLITPIMNMFNVDEIVGIDLDYTFTGQFDVLSERLNDKILWCPIEEFLDNSSTANHSIFLKKYKQIIQENNFKKLFTFEDISLWPYLENFFEKMLFAPYFPFYLHLIDSLKVYFSQNKPKTAIIPYETGSLALIIIGVLQSLDVKTIGLQHGYIYPKSPMYSHTNFYSNSNISGFIFPDYLLVFGDYVKNLLTKIGYPNEKLITFGNPALFKLQNFTGNFSENTLRKKLNISSNKKIILFTSGKMQRNYTTAGNYNFDEKIWESLLTNFKNSEEHFIILKPHPTETDVSIYETMQKQINNQNSKIIQHELFELIQLSSVLVSVVSSSMFEAISLQKPVIQVKFMNEIHPILDNANVVLTSNISDLSNSIIDMLNSTKQNIFKSNSNEFIKQHYGIPEENPELILKELIK